MRPVIRDGCVEGLKEEPESTVIAALSNKVPTTLWPTWMYVIGLESDRSRLRFFIRVGELEVCEGAPKRMHEKIYKRLDWPIF